MKKRHQRLKSALCLAGALCLSTVSFAKNHALLVGVSSYPSQPLEGPIHDVSALKSVLSEKWGFDSTSITTLVDEQASKNGILAAIDAVYARSKEGDNVFIYLSGHGTSSLDRDIRAPLPTTSGAYIPHDVAGVKTREELMQKLVIGRTDLRPRFDQFDANGRHLFVAIDACYSGNTVRGAARKKVRLPTRHLRLDQLVPRSFGEDISSGVTDWSQSDDVESPYPYTNTFYLGASGEHEKAEDIPSRMLSKYSTIDNKPHGAFTNSLLEVLHEPEKADLNKNGDITYAELRQTLKERMSERGFNHTPQGLPTIDQDEAALAQRQVFFFQQGEPEKVVTEERPETVVVEIPKTKEPLPEIKEQLSENKEQLPEVKEQLADNKESSPSEPESAEPESTDLVEMVSTAAAITAKVKLHPFMQFLKKDIQLIDGVELASGDFDLEVIPHGQNEIAMINKAGEQLAVVGLSDVSRLQSHLKYEAWLKRTLDTAKQNSHSIRLEASLAGAGKGSVLVDGEFIGFDLSLPDGGHLAILDYESSGYVNVIYPYNDSELKAYQKGSRIAMHELAKVTPPYGRDMIQIVVFEQDSPTYRELLRNSRFRYDDGFAESWAQAMSSQSAMASHVLQLITASKP